MRNNTRAVVEMTMAVLVMAGTVQAATFINTCPFVITSPGDYLLAADLICGGGDGITINSGNVTLKLEGHRITAGAGANRGIFVNGLSGGARSSVRILGPGLITNSGANTFSAGVFLSNTSNDEVSGITVLGAATGIATSLGGFSTFTANTLGRNRTGINIGDSINNTISDNDASGNETGIFIQVEIANTVATVSHNILNGNTGAGLVISVGDIAGGTVQNNVINGNGQYGISAFNPSFIVVTNNIVLANGTDLNGICGSGNTFFTANQSCIH